MSFTRQLSEMSASELNDAIDDTNFPQAHILSRGRNNSVCSTSSNSGITPLMDRALSQTDEPHILNDKGIVGASAGTTVNMTPTASVGFAGNAADVVTTPPTIGFTRPKLILKTNGIIPEHETDDNAPKTPKTPRTSTTPGLPTDNCCQQFKMCCCECLLCCECVMEILNVILMCCTISVECCGNA